MRAFARRATAVLVVKGCGAVHADSDKQFFVRKELRHVRRHQRRVRLDGEVDFCARPCVSLYGVRYTLEELDSGEEGLSALKRHRVRVEWQGEV